MSVTIDKWEMDRHTYRQIYECKDRQIVDRWTDKLTGRCEYEN